MSNEYRVVDLSSVSVDPAERIVAAASPEAAAREILGIDLVRSGAKKDLMARVYWQRPGDHMNMVRLYRKVGDDRVR